MITAIDTEDAMTRLMLAVCAASLAMGSVRADDTVRTCATYATYRDFSFHRFEDRYIESLNYPVPPVVESALRDVLAVKLAQPRLRCTGVYEKICDLAITGETPAVRYKAALVRFVFDFPQMFEGERGREYTNDQEIFSAIEARLHSSTLVMSR
jgi:hypothetical protein